MFAVDFLFHSHLINMQMKNSAQLLLVLVSGLFLITGGPAFATGHVDVEIKYFEFEGDGFSTDWSVCLKDNNQVILIRRLGGGVDG